jgi:GntR family transcriptional regulator / MocR family aminotransferase
MKQLDLSEWLLTQLNQSEFPPRMPAHRRVYESIRRAIVEGVMPSGARLPSTRGLSLDLNVSRNTILAAFEQLLDEGYVSATTGSGTFVCYNQTDSFTKVSNPAISLAISSIERQPNQLSKRGLIAAGLTTNQYNNQNNSYEVQPFTPGDDDYSRFPIAVWRRLLNRHWRALNPSLLDSSHDGGYLPLRQAVADYLRVSRAVNLSVDQVLITSGTQQSIDLCARLLSDENDIAWVENPCYWAAQRVLEINSLKLHAIKVDNEGLNPSLDDFKIKPKLIYTTPSHQYPKGMVMSYGRRRLLLDYAQNCNAWIIEDDYDSEFRFEGRPISSLQGMDLHDRVLYLGTFSKVMYPGIRLGYMVVPPQLIQGFKLGLYELQRPGQVMIQAALADFMEEGHFVSHIRRLKQTYAERRYLLQAALASIAEVGARLSPIDSGLHLVVEFDLHIDDVRISKLAEDIGLRIYPLSNYCLGEHIEKGLIIGYAYAATDKITRHGKQLAEVIQAALKY